MERFLVLALVLSLFVLSVSNASAQDETTKLSLKPVGVDGNFFSTTLSPGETRELTVELGNDGMSAVEARLYPADATSLVNGGFGARLDGEPISGVTTWLGLTPETVTLAPGASETRTFSISVPNDIESGEYISSVVIQNAIPTSTGGSGSVALNQINRQAIAVAVTIPGSLAPTFQIGTPSYQALNTRSVVRFDVQNTGNAHIKPDGEFVVKTTDGTEISRGPVTMGTVYTGTATLAEALLEQHLNPGEYLASLTMTDTKRGVTASTENLRLTVPEPPAANSTSSSAPTGTAVNQTTEEQEPATTGPSTMLLAGVGVLVLLLVLGLLFGVARSRRGHTPPTQPVARTADQSPKPLRVVTLDSPISYDDQEPPKPLRSLVSKRTQDHRRTGS